jgi:hypothetical protein
MAFAVILFKHCLAAADLTEPRLDPKAHPSTGANFLPPDGRTFTTAAMK